MNGRLGTILVVALVLAGVASLAVFRIMNRRAAAARPIASTKVVAAAHDIKLGAVLGQSDLTMIDETGQPPKGSFQKLEDVVGRGAVAEIYQGEPVLDSRLAARGSGGGLAATIPPGMRACAVRVDEVVGVAGFVTPGQRVDVLASGMRSGSNMIPINTGESFSARTILQNIQVLSAGTDIQKDAEGKPHSVQVVNLLVTPEAAETLTLASNQLRIQLVLRNPLDTSIADVHGMAMSNIMGDQQQQAVRPVRPAAAHTGPRAEPPVSYAVEILNGSTRSEQRFGASRTEQSFIALPPVQRAAAPQPDPRLSAPQLSPRVGAPEVKQ